jgi:putative lipoprotein
MRTTATLTATIAAALALSGCASGSLAGRLADHEWRAVDVNGYPVSARSGPTIRLVDGRASGTTGCNTYNAAYETSTRERIRITGVSTTRKMCEAPLMDQERRFTAILENAQSYSLYGDGSFSLIAADGAAIRFRR